MKIKLHELKSIIGEIVNEANSGTMIKQGPNGPSVEIYRVKPRKGLSADQFASFMDEVAQTDDRKKARATLSSYDLISFSLTRACHRSCE